jgi:hypothetical protein
MAAPICDFLPDNRDDFTGVCALCGFPLTKYQIAADFSGTMINYDEHCTIPCSFCFCTECLGRMMEYVNSGPDEAYRRVYVASVLTRQALEEYSTEE